MLVQTNYLYIKTAKTITQFAIWQQYSIEHGTWLTIHAPICCLPVISHLSLKRNQVACLLSLWPCLSGTLSWVQPQTTLTLLTTRYIITGWLLIKTHGISLNKLELNNCTKQSKAPFRPYFFMISIFVIKYHFTKNKNVSSRENRTSNINMRVQSRTDYVKDLLSLYKNQ